MEGAPEVVHEGRKRPKREAPKAGGVLLVGSDDTSVLLRALEDVRRRFPTMGFVTCAARTGESLQRVVKARSGARCVGEVCALAKKGAFERPRCAGDAGGRTFAAVEARRRCGRCDVGGPILDEDRVEAGAACGALDWALARAAVAAALAHHRERGDGEGDDSAVLGIVDEYAERCCYEAGHVVMKRIAQDAMAANRDPVCPWAFSPFVKNDAIRRYEKIPRYVAFPGASDAEEASVRAALRVGPRVAPGIVAAAYAVDDDQIGDAWRKEYVDAGDADQGAVVVASVVDALAAETVRRACAADAASHNPAFEPLALGADVAEVPALGVDCYARRAVEIAADLCRVPLEANFSRDVLIPALRDLAATTDKAVPSTLVAAAAAGSFAGGSRRRAAAAAVVSAAKWLGTEAAFRARPKGTGVVVTREAGLRASQYVCDYLGEVYPPYRWLEKLAAVTACRRSVLGRARADATPAPEAFHNIALERPQVDDRGYGLWFIDAGGDRANWASSCSHSCDGNLSSSVFARPDGSLSVALHTRRPVACGEELTFDYSACTSSEAEWRAAVCLCGSETCRGSFVELVSADENQQCLKRAHGPLDALAMLLRSCLPGTKTSDDRARAALARHGFKAAFFDYEDDDDDDDDRKKKTWLERYVGELVGFLEFERGQLPYALLRLDRAYDARSKQTAAARARLVLEQRVQALACAVSVSTRVARLSEAAAPPPLAVLTADETAAALRRVFDDLRALGDTCPDDRIGACLRVELGGAATRQAAKAALLAMRDNLVRFADEAKAQEEVGASKKGKKRPKQNQRDHGPSPRSFAACAADAILLVASTSTLVRVRPRSTVVAAAVPVKKAEVGPLKGGDTAAPGYRACDRAADSDVVAAPERAYGPLAEVEACLCWHDLDALAEPDLGDGTLARSHLRGCGFCPDPARILRASFAATANHPTAKGATRGRKGAPPLASYDARARRALADILRDPIKRVRPWPSDLAGLFFPEGGDDDERCRGGLPVLGSPALDGALESNFASVDACVATLLDGEVPAVSETSSPPRSSSSSSSSKNKDEATSPSKVDALAEALPDRPPSRWVACDACTKWRLIPWHADFDDAADSFTCADQVKWGTAAAEATCAFPEPTWGEEDMVFECSTLDVAELVSGAKVDARCEKTGVWFDSRVVAVDSVADTGETRVKLHFVGWHKKFDETFLLPRDTEKLAPHRTFSAANKEPQLNAQGSKKKKKAAAKRKAPAATTKGVKKKKAT